MNPDNVKDNLVLEVSRVINISCGCASAKYESGKTGVKFNMNGYSLTAMTVNELKCLKAVVDSAIAQFDV